MRLAMMTACMAVLTPLAAGAAKPSAGCAVLLPDSVQVGVPFEVKVRRVPAFPGQWFSPTITVDVVVQLVPEPSGPRRFTLTFEETFPGILTSNEATAIFTIPDLANIDAEADVDVFAMVSEPTSGRVSRDSFCEESTVLAP
jgi:hypothetical protein